MARFLIAAALLMGVTGCGSRQPDPSEIPPQPLPSSLLAGRKVTVYPLTMLLAADELAWDDAIGERTAALRRVDSLLADQLTSRLPEVEWVLPAVLRRTARQAPGMLPDPDQIGTSILRGSLDKVPDPLRSQLRVLTGATGDRHALVPASLFFYPEPDGAGRAELSLVLADVRTGDVRWRTLARGTGPDPWEAVEQALRTLTPGLP